MELILYGTFPERDTLSIVQTWVDIYCQVERTRGQQSTELHWELPFTSNYLFSFSIVISLPLKHCDLRLKYQRDVSGSMTAAVSR